MSRFAVLYLCFIATSAECSSCAFEDEDDTLAFVHHSLRLPSTAGQASPAAQTSLAITDATIENDMAIADESVKETSDQAAVEKIETESATELTPQLDDAVVQGATQKVKRAHTPIGDLKKEIKKLKEQMKQQTKQRAEMIIAYNRTVKEEHAAKEKYYSTKRKLEEVGKTQSQVIDAASKTYVCLEWCRCINQPMQGKTKSERKDLCDEKYTCSEDVMKSVQQEDTGSEESGIADVSGSNSGGSGNGEDGFSGDGSSGGDSSSSTASGSNGNDDGWYNPSAGGKGGKNGAGGSGSGGKPGSASTGDGGSSDGDDDYATGDGNNGDSSANIAEGEDGQESGKVAGTDSDSDSDYEDSDVTDEEAGKSLSFQPAICFALMAPLFHLM